MQYDIIVLGATFTAAGILQISGEKCFVVEERPQAGYEFLNALKLGFGYDEMMVSDEAKALLQHFAEKGVFDKGQLGLLNCAAPFYALLENKNIMLNVKIVSVEKSNEGFFVTIYGVTGFRTYTAKRIVDTRVHNNMLKSKSFNILVNGKSDFNREAQKNIKFQNCGDMGDTLLKCPVSVEADYIEARGKIVEIIRNLPQDYRVVMVADMFDCEVKKDLQPEENGIIYMPSCAYKNPLLAFDAGVLYAKGGER